MIDTRRGRATATPGIRSVTPDARVRLLSELWRPDKDLGSLFTVEKSSGVDTAWNKRDLQGRTITGKGVGVALIDSGVVPVDGLTVPERS